MQIESRYRGETRGLYVARLLALQAVRETPAFAFFDASQVRLWTIKWIICAALFSKIPCEAYFMGPHLLTLLAEKVFGNIQKFHHSPPSQFCCISDRKSAREQNVLTKYRRDIPFFRFSLTLFFDAETRLAFLAAIEMAFVGAFTLPKFGIKLNCQPVRNVCRSAHRVPVLLSARMMSNLPKDPKEMTESDWKDVLQPREYHVLRQKGTEPAGTGEYDKFYRKFQSIVVPLSRQLHSRCQCSTNIVLTRCLYS